MAGENDITGVDDPRAKDAKGGAPKKKQPPPGKTTNGDAQGVTPAIPGKRTNTDGMTADAPGVGKTTQVDASEGKDGGKDAKGAGAGGGGGGADKTANADHNAAGGDEGKQLGGGGGTGKANGATGKKDKEPAAKAKKAGGDDEKVAGKAPKEGGSLHDEKSVTPAQRVDSTAPGPIAAFTIPPPRANKNLSDTWQKETGRTVEQHHEQIVNALNAVQAEVQAKQTELMTLVDTEVTKVTGEITAKVEGFKSSAIAPGKARVEGAYAGLGKSFETAEQKALADITKQKAAGKAAIDTAKKSNGDGMSKKIVAAKAVVAATITKNVPTASAAIKKWAAGIPNWVKSAKDQAKTAAENAAKTHDPKKGNSGSKDSGLLALQEDVAKNHKLKHGEKLGKQYESSLLTWGKDTDKKADELVRKALDASKVEFEAALDTADKSSKKGFDDGIKSATATVDTGESTAKKAVGDAKTNGIKKFDTEKKDAVDAADKAGKELTDNATAAGTELTDRIKKKANDDGKNYGLLAADLQKQFSSGKPMKFEQAQPKIDNAKAQLGKMHQQNTTDLQTLVTAGKTELATTFGKQQETYDKAIKDREDSAKKTEADVIKDIGKGATEMATSIGNVGKTFTDVTEKESKRVDAMIAEFNQNADAATKDFGTKITAHLEGSRKGLEDNLKANLEPAKIAEDTQGPIQQEIAAKSKSIANDDTSALRNAMDGWGTDENKIYGVLRKQSYGEITYLEAMYQDHFPQRAKGGKNALRADFEDEMSGNDLKTATAYLDHDRTQAIKLELADSKGFWNDDEARIEEVMRGCSEDEIKFLNTDPEAIKVVNDVKGNLGGADLDMMTTLLDQSIDKDDRKLKADAIGLFGAMDGIGTDEAKMKKILGECKTEEDRAKMREYFNTYAKSKGYDGGTGTEDNDALALAIKDEVSTIGGSGEQNSMLALAAVKRDEDDIKAAKMVEAADGAGTDEDKIFEALDDEEYNKKWAAATPEDKKKLEEARRKMLDAKIAKMSGGKWDSAQGLIDDEMSKANVTYGEFVDGKRENGTPLTPAELSQIKSRDPSVNKLQWMVAQRKLQTGAAEPELMLAYAMWGVVGTDEDAIKKVFGPEPKSIGAVTTITKAFQTRWGVPLVSHCELQDMKRGAPTGVLADELSGKDWFETRMLLAGKPETAEQLKYISDQRKKFNKGGVIASGLMSFGEAIGFTEAKSTAEATEKRFDDEYEKKFGKNPTAKLGTADSKTLEELGDYLAKDYEAYSASLNSLVDGIITALEIVGGVIITVVTAGTASPVLAAVIANLVLSAGTITFKYAALGDQYGAAELGADVVKAVGTSAFAGLGELKAMKTITEAAGNKIASGAQKLSQLANQAATKAGMKIGAKGALEMGDAATKKLAGIVAAGTKNVILGAGQEVYNTLTDEKTYDKKLGEALWGEDSLGAKILKGIPKSFAEGAVTQWINESAGTSNKDNAGRSTGPRSNALTNAIAEMGGATAGFFVYVDNYQDAEQFWMQLLKTNANKAVSGALNGYAMHKTRAKKLGRDFINGDMLPDGLTEMMKSMDAHEIQDLAKFVEKYGGDKVKSLPEGFKQYLGATAKPAADANATTTATAKPASSNAPKADAGEGGGGGEVSTSEPRTEKKNEAAPPTTQHDDVDEQKAAKPAAGSKEEDLQAKAAAKNKPPEEEPTSHLKDDEQKKATAAPTDEAKLKADAEHLLAVQEARKKMSVDERAAEVAKARADTAERDKALVDEIHQLAPAGAKQTGPDGKELTGPAAPVDVQKVFDSITLGGGFAGVANQASKPPGDSIMIAAGGNPWDKAKNRFGQPPGESEVPGAKTGHGMKETASDANARFMLASEHADNVALNKNDHQMKTYPGASGPAEAKDAKTWPKWALESGANVRIPVVGPDGTTRYFYAKQVDVAVGPGPARMLPESVLDADTLKKMKAGKAFFLGDQSFTGDEIQPGDHVAAFGGGASAAWGVEASSKNAGSVEWIARIPDRQTRDDLHAKLKGLHQELHEARKSGDPTRIKAAETAISDFTFTEAERNGFLPRNRLPGGAFDPNKQVGGSDDGNISRRGIEDCKKIEYVEHEGKMQVKLTFIEHNHPEGPREVSVYKDKLILSIGQDAHGAGGPVGLVKNYESQLQPIFGEPDATGFKPVVGVQSPDGSLRILGAAATPNEMSHMLDQNVMTHKEHQANLTAQADKLPEDSKGVVGGFALAQKHIEAANRQLAKKVQETADEQRADAGLGPKKKDKPAAAPDDEKDAASGKATTPKKVDEEHLDDTKDTKAPASAKEAQEAHPTRKNEIHLGDDTPAKAPGPTEAGLRGELDELSKLRAAHKKALPAEKADIEAQIKARQAALDVKLKDPANKDALLDPHVAFALAREASNGDRSTALHDFLRANINEFRKAQDQARQGADPELRAKREVFEREVAKLVLEKGPVKKAVDDNLDDMCLKAIDYILKSRKDSEHEAAFADLGAQASHGYAGAVLDGNDTAKNAKVMGDVLLNGNVRERMIALGKFSEMVATDMLRNPEKFEAAAAKSKDAKAGEFSAADANAFKARMQAYLKDRGWKEGDPLPTEKNFEKDFLKPSKDEKQTSQAAYHDAKEQGMDTKLPSVSTAPATQGDEVFPAAHLAEGTKGTGQTGEGEKSSLARTTITVEEAEKMGYHLSDREKEIAAKNGGKLPWIVGTVANVVDPSAQFIAEGSKNSLPQKAGISGTTFRFMEASQLLGGDPAMSRLAMIGALQTIDAHTVYEIASASKGFGVAFDATKPYDNMGIPRSVLEELALKTGTSLAELNGETTKTPLPTKEPAKE